MNFPSAESTRRNAGRLAAFSWLIAVAAAPGQGAAQTTGSLPDHCARLGEGFVAVAGSDACVRIGGHVRADFYDGKAVVGSEAARTGARPVAERHIRAGSGWTGLYPR